MVGDHYRDKWWPTYPLQPFQQPSGPGQTTTVVFPMPAPVSREEFDALKRDVEEMKALLKRAKEYDERNGEPECEMDEKMAVLRKLAEMVGVNLDDVLGPKSS
jgi:hypothetical protein